MSVASLLRYNGSREHRGLSAALWRGAVEGAVLLNPELGSFEFDDFLVPLSNTTDASADAHGWFIQDAAAGGTSESFASIAAQHGKRRLSATAGTAHFGIEAHKGATATSVGEVTLDDGELIIVEFLLDISDANSIFVGLTEPIVEFLSATSTLPANSDFIGFYKVSDGDLVFHSFNDNNGGTASSHSETVVDSADLTDVIKLGFRKNPDQTLEICVNGVLYPQLSKNFVEADIPIEALTRKLAVTSGSGTANVALDIDWCAIYHGDIADVIS